MPTKPHGPEVIGVKRVQQEEFPKSMKGTTRQ